MSASMPCPKCGSCDSRVADKRVRHGLIRRRRVCAGCGYRFSTQESVAETLRRGRAAVRDRVKVVTLTDAERESARAYYRRMRGMLRI